MLERKADTDEVRFVLECVDNSANVNNEIIKSARLGCILTEEEAINEAEKQIKEIKDQHYIKPEKISILMLSVSYIFSKSLKLSINTVDLIEHYESHINIPDHALYRQVLRYNLATGKVTSENLITEINSRNDRFIAAQIPLIDNGNDLFRVCIKDSHVDIRTALKLMWEVNNQSLADSRKSDLWRVKLLKNFIEKLSRDRKLTSEEVRTIVTVDLQNMINRHINVDYTSDINNIVREIKAMKDRYNITGFFALNFPLSSIYPNMRHNAWKYYVDTQTLDSIHESSLNWFIKREHKWLENNPSEDRSYLQMALKELHRRNPGDK